MAGFNAVNPVDIGYDLQIARGMVPGLSAISKFGSNDDIDVGTEDVWSEGGTWVAPTQARVHDVVSSIAADTAAGTGARTVLVVGLDGSYAVVSEVMVLNGLAPVATVRSYAIVYTISVLTAGTGGTNAGKITATARTDGTVTAAAPAGKGNARMAIYQVPDGYDGFVWSFFCGVHRTASARLDAELCSMEPGARWIVQQSVPVHVGGTSFVRHDFKYPLHLRARDTVKLQGTSDSNNTEAHGGFEILLVAN